MKRSTFFSITKSQIMSLLALSLFLVITGCRGVLEQPAYETPTPSSTPSPSETIIWFPATSTGTLVPTREPEPTEDLHPAVGDLIFRDDFSSEGLWSTQTEEGGNITYGNRELTLAVQEPKKYIASLFSNRVIDNASVEITSNVTLCKAEDSYGILVRASNGLNGYRFQVNCQGQVRLELLKSGRAYSLVDWSQSGQVLPGSPFQLRLRVWIVEDEIRFFLNDNFQFSARDATYKNGSIGVFARQAADTPLTVNFTNLTVHEIESGFILPKATPKPTATRPGSYKLVNTPVPSVKP
ncbi:MAG: hypothetical protein GX577_13700 [Leptolinea sp.]|nr:hypothetical protein [Leptolinea sp.]